MENMRHRLLLVCLNGILWSCSPAEQDRSSSLAPYAISTTAYAVLAEKAIMYQFDFNWNGFADMLAEEVEYVPADSLRPLVGKPAVVAYWRQWPQRSGLCSVRLSGFTHIPLQINTPLPLPGKTGVYVISYCTAELRYADGRRHACRLNLCCHFDASKRIDRYMVFS